MPRRILEKLTSGGLCRKESFHCKKDAGRLFEAETVEYVLPAVPEEFCIGGALIQL